MDYKNKIITVGQALDMVKSGMRIALGDATVEPQAFLENIHTIADRVKDVELTNCLGLRSYPFMENSAYHDSFILRSLFFSKPTREAEKYLRVSYVRRAPFWRRASPICSSPPARLPTRRAT